MTQSQQDDAFDEMKVMNTEMLKVLGDVHLSIKTGSSIHADRDLHDRIITTIAKARKIREKQP